MIAIVAPCQTYVRGYILDAGLKTGEYQILSAAGPRAWVGARGFSEYRVLGDIGEHALLDVKRNAAAADAPVVYVDRP